MGGYISFEIMRQAPSRVSKLALIDTSARSDTIEQTDARFQTLARARTRFTAIALLSLAGLLHPERRGDPDLLEISLRMVQTVGLEGFERQLKVAISRPDSRPFLSSIEVPTLVLVGDCDPLTPPSHSKEIASAIRGSTLKVIPDCGHLSPIERPQVVTRAIGEWIRG